jgi:trk system potassium uptake protein TrkA
LATTTGQTENKAPTWAKGGALVYRIATPDQANMLPEVEKGLAITANLLDGSIRQIPIMNGIIGHDHPGPWNWDGSWPYWDRVTFRAKDWVTLHDFMQRMKVQHNVLVSFHVNLTDVNAAIVAIGEDREASILATAIIKELGIENIIARRAGELHGKILEKVGATRVISPEINIADQLARNLISPGLLEHIALPDGHTIFQVEARPEFYNKTLIELDFRRNFGLLVVGIQRKVPNISESGEVYYETETISLPSATEAIRQDDILVLVGMQRDIERFLAKE